jgi:hypothetical protein
MSTEVQMADQGIKSNLDKERFYDEASVLFHSYNFDCILDEIGSTLSCLRAALHQMFLCTQVGTLLT